MNERVIVEYISVDKYINEQNPRTSWKSVVTFDILRLIAAILVVFHHYLYSGIVDHYKGGIGEIFAGNFMFPDLIPYSWWGWIGVYIFFVISGFVIAMSAQGKSATDFAIGRFVRIYPALFVFATLAFVVLAAVSSVSGTDLLWAWLRALTLVPRGPWIDGAIWTLTIEVLFYALIFMLIVANKQQLISACTNAYLMLAAVFWLAVFAERYAGYHIVGLSFSQIASSYPAKFFLLTTGSFFALGIHLYEAYLKGYNVRRLFSIGASIAISVAALHAFAISSPAVTQFGQSPFVPVIAWLVAVAACLVAIPIERRHTPAKVYRQFGRRLGLITYPLYLINQITGAFLVYTLFKMGLPPFAAVIGGVGLILVISWLFAEFVEPVLRLNLEKACRLAVSPLTAEIAARRGNVT
jgi:peptidoglycan/LPS O-acetylase OafA/YrhL